MPMIPLSLFGAILSSFLIFLPFPVDAYQILGGTTQPQHSQPDRPDDASPPSLPHMVNFRHLQRTLEFDQQEHESNGSVSMAGTPWEASYVLADYLTNPSNNLDLVDKTVVELGAGIGICSVAAALMGAKVVATDASTTSLRLIRKNVQRYENEFQHPVEVLPLLWGDVPVIKQFPKPDIVLASDVVYHNSNRGSLRTTIDLFYEPNYGYDAHTFSTEAILAHTWRTSPEVDEAYFSTYEDICGFQRMEVPGSLLPNEYQQKDSFGRFPVSIFRMRKNNS